MPKTMRATLKTAAGNVIATYAGPAEESQEDAAKTVEMSLQEASLDERGLEGVSGWKYSIGGKRRHADPGVGLAFVNRRRYVVDVCGCLTEEP